jgi:hypothetical protein
MSEPDFSWASLQTARRGHKSASFWGAKNSSYRSDPLKGKGAGVPFLWFVSLGKQRNEHDYNVSTNTIIFSVFRLVLKPKV